MTQSISRETRRHAPEPPTAAPPEPRRDWQVIGVRVFTAINALAGVGLGATDLAGGGGVHLTGPAMAAFILATIGAAVLILLSQIASRREFWQRGQLDGWIRGWNGQAPEVHDPLLRHPE